MAVVVRTCSVAELSESRTFTALLIEYAEESCMGGLPEPQPHWESYYSIERAGMLHALGAFVDDALAGFAIVLTAILPHYSVLMAHTESFFIASEHRKTGAGLLLMRAVEEKASSLNAFGLFMSAPVGSRLEQVLDESAGYHETNRVFLKVFG